jgi:hypothetical protein
MMAQGRCLCLPFAMAMAMPTPSPSASVSASANVEGMKASTAAVAPVVEGQVVSAESTTAGNTAISRLLSVAEQAMFADYDFERHCVATEVICDVEEEEESVEEVVRRHGPEAASAALGSRTVHSRHHLDIRPARPSQFTPEPAQARGRGPRV